MQDTKMPWASLWLDVLPLTGFGFALNKGGLRNALSLKHGRPLKGLPAICPSGQKYKVTHTPNCKKGGFVTTRYKNLRDFEALHALENILEIIFSYLSPVLIANRSTMCLWDTEHCLPILLLRNNILLRNLPYLKVWATQVVLILSF